MVVVVVVGLLLLVVVVELVVVQYVQVWVIDINNEKKKLRIIMMIFPTSYSLSLSRPLKYAVGGCKAVGVPEAHFNCISHLSPEPLSHVENKDQKTI